MKTRREFLQTSGSLTLGTLLMPHFMKVTKIKNVGIQLYTVRDAMMEDAVGTLKKVAEIGYKELESARSEKGNYYGLAPKEIKEIVKDLGMTLRSGHVHIDENWQRTLDEAAETGQDYLICSTMPTRGQTVDNYKKVADTFNKAAEDCKKVNITFGYHNHEYEFESENGQVLYDVLLDNTDPKLVTMEMDLGWVVAAGHNPLKYFQRYPGRFPLWHLKDMKDNEAVSTEFGEGRLDISLMLLNAKQSGMKYFFVEQEEYANNPFESIQQNYAYLMHMNS